MRSDDVCRAMGSAPKERFKKRSEDADESDFYSEFFAYYDRGRCDAVEFFGGDVRLGGLPLLGPVYPQTLRALAELDPGLLCGNDGCVSLACGVPIYVPHAKALGEPDEEPPKVEGAMAFERGYYDDLLERRPGALGEPVSELRARGLLP